MLEKRKCWSEDGMLRLDFVLRTMMTPSKGVGAKFGSEKKNVNGGEKIKGLIQ